MEMLNLGVRSDNIEIDFEVGDLVSVVAGVWKDTTGVVRAINQSKQSVTINVEMFGRETPVEIGFAEIRKV
jgi:transcriptional antiterminator NusG